MQIGDKIIVTYADLSQKVGRIVGETEKQWKIAFDEDGEVKRINKTMKVELIDDPKTPFPEVVSIDSRSLLVKFLDWLKHLFKNKK